MYVLDTQKTNGLQRKCARQLRGRNSPSVLTFWTHLLFEFVRKSAHNVKHFKYLHHHQNPID